MSMKVWSKAEELIGTKLMDEDLRREAVSLLIAPGLPRKR